MKNQCDRCQEYTFDNPGLNFCIYHSLLCRSCRNDFEVWVRTQEFWKDYLDMEATQRLIDLGKGQNVYSFEGIRDIIAHWDEIKLTAFPLIEAWVKAGRAKA